MGAGRSDRLLQKGNLCGHRRQTWASVPPEANRSPALEKATVITAPYGNKENNKLPVKSRNNSNNMIISVFWCECRDTVVQHHLVAVEGVDEASLQQVQDLDRAVTGAADQVVVGRMDGEAVDPGAVNCSKIYKTIRKEFTTAEQ